MTQLTSGSKLCRNLWSYYDSMLWGNTANFVVKTCRVIRIKLKVMSQTFLRACPTSWRENSWHRYGMKKLRHCHSMYISQFAGSRIHLFDLLNSLYSVFLSSCSFGDSLVHPSSPTFAASDLVSVCRQLLAPFRQVRSFHFTLSEILPFYSHFYRATQLC